jgi:LysR family transcriptional activator of nhaA
MPWLNFHHLFYFWTVARSGSIAAASAQLRLAPSTISGQVGALEWALEHKLLVRHGRGLALSDVGKRVFEYAEQIFRLGQDLQGAMSGESQPAALRVGIADGIAAPLARRLLQPALELAPPVRLICRTDATERLFAELGSQALDLVLTDAPLPRASEQRAITVPLGDTEVVLCAAPLLARRYRRGFPRSLEGAPWLLPVSGSELRRALGCWFEAVRVRPHVVGELQDTGLLAELGRAGAGLFVLPAVMAAEATRSGGLEVVASLPEVCERFYLSAGAARLQHPAFEAIRRAARHLLGRELPLAANQPQGCGGAAGRGLP